MTAAFACRRATAADADTIDLLARDLHALHNAEWPALFSEAGPPGRDRAHWHAALTAEGLHRLPGRARRRGARLRHGRGGARERQLSSRRCATR